MPFILEEYIAPYFITPQTRITTNSIDVAYYLNIYYLIVYTYFIF